MTTATHPTPTPAPPTFSKLGSRISLYTPPAHTAGELIILCTWLGALRKHIDKYIAAYRSIASNAKILLIQSDVTSVTSSYASQRKAIMPATEVVLSEGSSEGPKILLHTFSNGGPISATALVLALKTTFGKPLPLIGIIMDSGPAAGYYWKSYNAMVLSLPPGLARTLGYVVVHGILLGLFVSVAFGRYEYPEVLVRRTLLDEEYVKGGRICYVYSKADKMTDWLDIVEHAHMARGKGWQVEEWRLEHTAHCNHFSKNEQGYVGRMRGMWDGEVLST
jgi:hypothetical protein